MNYLVATDSWFLDSPGGSARVAWDLALLARDVGWNVTLFCIDPRSDRPSPSMPIRHDEVTIIRYSRATLATWNPARLHTYVTAACMATRRWLTDAPWDAVHIHSPVTGAGVMQALGPATRYICTVHSPIAREQIVNWTAQGPIGRVKRLLGLRSLRRLEHRLLVGSSEIHALSGYTRDEIENQHGLGARVTVVPHWLRDTQASDITKAEARRRLGWPTYRPIFFTVRQHRERYGLDVAIRAMAGVVMNSDAILYIGGDGPLRSALEALAGSLSLRERVFFTGILSDESLDLAYRAADAFILPTLELECFGLIILEALGSGCPVIGTDCGAIPELLAPILPDFIVRAGSPTELGAKMCELLSGSLPHPSPGELIRYARQEYSRAHVGPRLLQLIRGTATTGDPAANLPQCAP